MTTAPLRLGISRCLLGDEVRFDGGHKRDNFLTDVFGRYVEWVPVCPEVEAGLGTPREAMRLVGDPQHPRLVTIKSGTDHTRALETMTTNRIEELKNLDLSGYVFKKGSPSCGIERVRIYNEHGMPSRNGVGTVCAGLYRAVSADSGRGRRAALRSYAQGEFYRAGLLLPPLAGSRAERSHEAGLVQFHTIHKYLLIGPQPAAIPGARAAGRSGASVPSQGTRPPIWGTVHESVGREGDGAQARERAPAHSWGISRSGSALTRKPSCWA